MRIRALAVSSALPLLTVTAPGCAPQADPVGWQRWVHDEVKGHSYDPAWQRPGVATALTQFGLDYRDRRDRKRLDSDGMDRHLVPELRAELVRQGVPVDSSDGVMFVDAAAEKARNTLCPEDVPAHLRASGTPPWVWAGRGGRGGLGPVRSADRRPPSSPC